MKEDVTAHRGKQNNQKLKPYLVLQYLLKNTDEDHLVSAYDIIDHLEQCGITAERRSIYRDIDDINKIMWLVENRENDEELDIFDAEEAISADDSDEEKIVVYDKKRKGFYVRQRHYDMNDVRLLAECVYSAKFLSEGQAKRLANVVCDLVSGYQAEKIRHDAFLTDRVKTPNKSVLNNIAIINDAMSNRLDGEIHEPEKISFQYLKYSIKNVGQQVERHKGLKYTVSPYKLLINDSNYYLLAFDDYSQAMRTYRVDRMKNVSFTGVPRDGECVFREIDLKSYTKRAFSMFGGEEIMVRLAFDDSLLDAVVEKFGTDAIYVKTDDKHFEIHAKVAISEQFFGWILGFGEKVKLIAPDDALERFKAYIDNIRNMY